MATVAHDIGEALPVFGGFFRASAANKRMKEAQKALKAMGPVNYTGSPELAGYYTDAVREAAAPQGLTPQALGVARNQIAGQVNTNIRNARNVAGGGFSQAINAALNNYGVNAATTLGAQDAELRYMNRNNALGRLGSAVNTYQQLRNLNTQKDLQTQAAYGQAIQDARREKSANLSQIGSDLVSAAGFATGMGLFGKTPKFGAPMTTATPAATNYFNPFQSGYSGTVGSGIYGMPNYNEIGEPIRY